MTATDSDLDRCINLSLSLSSLISFFSFSLPLSPLFPYILKFDIITDTCLNSYLNYSNVNLEIILFYIIQTSHTRGSLTAQQFYGLNFLSSKGNGIIMKTSGNEPIGYCVQFHLAGKCSVGPMIHYSNVSVNTSQFIYTLFCRTHEPLFQMLCNLVLVHFYLFRVYYVQIQIVACLSYELIPSELSQLFK